MYSIAVSGKCSTGKTTLCENISNIIHWKHIDIGSEFKRLSKEYNLTIEKFGSLPDAILRSIDDRLKERMNKDYEIIWDSRLSCYLAKDNPNVFKVYCWADLKTRIKKTSMRENISLYKAKIKIKKREEEELNVFRRLYNLYNPYSNEWINYKINTSDEDPIILSKKIIKEFNHRKRSFERFHLE
jgi:cytidylate kinase